MPLRLIILDDIKPITQEIASYFKDQHFNVEQCTNTKELLKKVKVFNPQVFICTQRNNKYNALEICKQVFNLNINNDLVIVLISENILGKSELPTSGKCHIDLIINRPLVKSYMLRKIANLYIAKSKNNYVLKKHSISSIMHQFNTQLHTLHMVLGYDLVKEKNTTNNPFIKESKNALYHLQRYINKYVLFNELAAYRVNTVRFSEQHIHIIIKSIEENYAITLYPKPYIHFKPILCDYYLLEKLLTELFENATYHGNITQPIFFSFIVIDMQIHIKLVYYSQKFTLAKYKTVKPFIKDINKAENTTKGLGIGITLCQNIIKKVDGTLNYTYNKYNDSSSYYIKWPIMDKE